MCYFLLRSIKAREGTTPRGARAAAAWPRCWEFLRWLKLAGGVHLHPLEQSHREHRRALDVPNDWREQEQHRVSCANTFIILRYPPTDRVHCLQPPTVAVESTDVSLMQNCSRCSTPSEIPLMHFAVACVSHFST